MNLLHRRRMMAQVAQPQRNYFLFMPLTQYDTTDHVSGANTWNSPHMAWDNNEGAWYFEQSSQGENKLVGVTLPWQNTRDIECTFEFDAKLVNTGNFSMMGFGCNSGTAYCDHSLYYQHVITGTNGYLPQGQWAHIKTVRTIGGNITHFTNGVQVGTLTQNNANSGTGTVRFSPTGSRWQSNAGVHIYLKNIEIYL